MSNSITITRGKTFTQIIRWETLPIVYRPITGIAQSAPAAITCPSHGVPDGWRVAIVSVKGMRRINASNPPRPEEYHQATVVDADTITLNDVNAASYDAWTSGGYVQYYTPMDLTGFTARMLVKDEIGGTVLVELTTENGGISIDNTKKTITRTLSATATAAFTWDQGVCDLELVSPTGVVTGLGGVVDVFVAGEVTT